MKTLRWWRTLFLASLCATGCTAGGNYAPPDDPHSFSGLKHLNQGNSLKAILEFSEALKADPDNFICLKYRGVAYYRSGDMPSALRDYEHAARVAPSDIQKKDMLKTVGDFYLSHFKNFPAAIASLDQALKLDSRDVEAHTSKGVAHFLNGDSDTALAELDKALALDPRNARAWTRRGNVLFDLARYPQAMECFDRAIACDYRYADAYECRALLWMALKNPGRAKGDLDHVKSLGKASQNAKGTSATQD